MRPTATQTQNGGAQKSLSEDSETPYKDIYNRAGVCFFAVGWEARFGVFLETANRDHQAGGVFITTEKRNGSVIVRIRVGEVIVTVTIKDP